MWVKVDVRAHIPIQDARHILRWSFQETFLLVVCMSRVSLYYFCFVSMGGEDSVFFSS